MQQEDDGKKIADDVTLIRDRSNDTLQVMAGEIRRRNDNKGYSSIRDRFALPEGRQKAFSAAGGDSA
jgi:hypothetical protein